MVISSPVSWFRIQKSEKVPPVSMPILYVVIANQLLYYGITVKIYLRIKDDLGFRRVTMRGKEYTRGQWLFTCAVHNVMKAVRFISRIRQEDRFPDRTC